MTRIRELRRDDIPQVVELYQQVVRSGGTSPPGLEPYFARTLLDYPWADPDIPSLVHETDDGRVLGFLGSHVRRLRLDRETVRMGCVGQLVTHPSVRRRGVGTLLTRRYLSGPQDVSITDGATAEVAEVWQRLGGHTSYLRSLNWMHLFKPWRSIGEELLERQGRSKLKWIARPAWAALDAMTNNIPGVRRSASAPASNTRALEPRELVERYESLAENSRLRPAYDEPFVDWLLSEMAEVHSRGRLARRLVMAPNSRVLGWYVAYLLRGGVSQVQQVVAAPADVGDVLDQLFHDARRTGSAALQGRAEPLLFEPLSSRRCVFLFAQRALVHSRTRPDIVAAIALGQDLLTRMDGESWMGHHTESFERGQADVRRHDITERAASG